MGFVSRTATMIPAAAQFVILMSIFSLIEGFWPSAREHKWWRRPLLVDLCSWSIHPLAIAAGIALAVAFTDVLLSQFRQQGFWLGFSSLRAHVGAFAP